MKTLNDLFDLIAQASQIKVLFNLWFFEYNGETNYLSIRYSKEELKVYLNERGIQNAYYFIKSRL